MLQSGDILQNRFQILQLIGRGGMADVYLALDTRRQARVAIKVLREDLAEDPDFVRRFAREARTLAQLDHPNIVRFYSFEQEGLTAFMVMDFVDGVTLRRLLAERKAPLRIDETTSILHQVSAALHYAHANGIIHRDLKPGNIMVQQDGKALLADFGIAKIVESATMTTASVGTPAYMSPEQILNRPLDARSDIYSLGVTLYQMATGRRPFTGDEPGLTGTGTTARVREAHLRVPPLDPYRLNSRLPAAAGQVILKAMAKRPQDRWRDVITMMGAWDRAVGSDATQRLIPLASVPASRYATATPAATPPAPPAPPPSSAYPSHPEQPTPKNQRTPALIAMGVVAVVALVLIWLFLPKSSHEITPAPSFSPPSPTTQKKEEPSTPGVTATVDVQGTAQSLAATYAVATKASEKTVNAIAESRTQATMSAIAATSTTEAMNQAATVQARQATEQAIALTETTLASLAATATIQAQATRAAQAEATRIAVATATARASGPPSCSIPVGGDFRYLWSQPTVYKKLGCPTGQAHQSMAAEEQFERGIMVWRDTTDSVYVLYDDGKWLQYQDHFRNGVDPEFTCGIHQSPPSAQRGFGKVWCKPEVMNRIGNAIEAEVGYGMPGGGPAEIFQDFQGGMMYNSYHFNTIFILFSDGTWRR